MWAVSALESATLLNGRYHVLRPSGRGGADPFEIVRTLFEGASKALDIPVPRTST